MRTKLDNLVNRLVDVDLDCSSAKNQVHDILDQIDKIFDEICKYPDNQIVVSELCKKHDFYPIFFQLACSTNYHTSVTGATDGTTEAKIYNFCLKIIANISAYICDATNKMVKADYIEMFIKEFKTNATDRLKLSAVFLSNLSLESKDHIRMLLNKGYLGAIFANFSRAESTNNMLIYTVTMKNLEMLLKFSERYTVLDLYQENVTFFV